MRSEIHDRAQCATWSSPFFFALAMATSLVQFSGFAIAAVPVEESVAGDRAPVAQPAEASAQRADLETGVGDEATPDGAGRLSELFYRMVFGTCSRS